MSRPALLLLLLNTSAAAAATSPLGPITLFRGGAAAGAADEAKAKLSKWWASKVPASKVLASSPERERATQLMKKRGLSNCEQAVKLLRTAHQAAPDDVQLQLELADALNAVMRIKTNANALVIEGTLDSPSNKKIWGTLGREALPLAKSAYKALPNDVRALAVYADSYLFECSSKGMIKQALSGAAKEYKRIANELRKHPEWDSAVGCVLLGGFFNVAPWPVGNKEAARKLLLEASQRAPRSRRNLYYVGVNAYQACERARAPASRV